MQRRWISFGLLLLAIAIPVAAQTGGGNAAPTDATDGDNKKTDLDVGPRDTNDSLGGTPSRRSRPNRELDDRATAGSADDVPAAKPGEMKKLSERPGRRNATRVSGGAAKLPDDQGQIWREYDISPYTTRVTTTKRPQQAVIDWVLRETGYEAWHAETVAVLNADNRTLRVYHTPEIQRTVADIVDRFVGTQAESHGFTLRVVTIGSPNWRETAVRMMKPIPVQAQGIQAWLMAKEDAAILMSQISRRSDFREYTSPNLVVHNGQPTVVGASRARQYAKNVLMRPGSVYGIEMEMGQIDEGYSLEFSPLMSLDGKSIDAVVKCQINQVEKMIPVSLDVPIPNGVQRPTVEVPQLSSCDLHERFRFPADQVLLISRGVVATPAPKGASLIPIPLPGANSGNRADALVFVQSQGKAAAPAATVPNAAAPNGAAFDPSATPGPRAANRRYHGRY